MGVPPDEHLPEVAADTSPQAVPDGLPQVISSREAFQHQKDLDGVPMYSFDSPDSPKYLDPPVGLESASTYYYSGTEPRSGVPWEPQSAVDGLPAGTVTGTATSTYLGDNEKGGGAPSDEEERIWGLRKRPFYALLAVLLVFLAAAVGAGVGGGLAASNSSRQQSKTEDSQAGTTTTAPAPSPTLNAPTNQTTGTGPAQPDKNLNETQAIGTHKFQGWAKENFTGQDTGVLHYYGFVDFNFQVTSYIWDPTGRTCCVTFCNGKNDTSGNYWCNYRERKKASGSFNRINMVCGSADKDNGITGKAQPCS